MNVSASYESKTHSIRYIQVAWMLQIEGFFASDLGKTGWANDHPAHPVAPPLTCQVVGQHGQLR